MTNVREFSGNTGLAPQVEASPVPAAHNAEPAKRFYRPELDILRFGAFLMVFVSHALPRRVEEYTSIGVPGYWGIRLLCGAVWAGAYGVDVFFALSSYLITTLLLREHRQFGSIDIRAFYARRILRIWPLYFAFLLIVVPILNALLPHEQLTIGYLVPFLLLAGNWAYALASPPPSSAAALWSVSIEEQFYLVWPLIMSRWAKRIAAIAVGMLVVASASRLILIAFGVTKLGIWCNTLTRLDPLAIGVLMAVWLDRREWRPSERSRVSLAAIGLALIYAAGLWGNQDGWVALYSYPSVAVGAGMVIMSVLGIRLGGGWLVRSLTHLGKISYGLYVFHLASIAVFWQSHPSMSRGVAGKLAGFLLTVAIAMLSYRYFESPFLRLKETFARVITRPA